MQTTTTVRIDRATHEQLRRLAAAEGTTVGETVARAVRLLRQARMGHELRSELSDEEQAWLDADLG